MSIAKQKLVPSKYGDGTIRVRKDGTYETRIYNSRTGKQESVYGKSKAEVNRKVRAKKQEILLNKSTGLTKLTVEEYSLGWLRKYKYRSIRDSTFDKHEQMLMNHVIPNLGYLKMQSVKSDDLQELFNDLANRKAYSTIKKVYEVVYQVFAHALLVKAIEINPIEAVILPKEENLKVKTKEIEIYTDDELRMLHDVMIDVYDEKGKYRLAPMYLFLANTGLRRGELMAALWTDVNLEKKQIDINKTLSRVKNRTPDTLEPLPGYQPVITKPKTKSSIRTVPLNDTAIWCLEEMIRRNNLEGISSEYVCCNSDGGMLCTRSFDQMLERLCKTAGIKFRGLHAFRHSFATRCFAKGIDVKIVSKLLGHSSVNITYSTYIHVLKDQEITAVELLNDI